MAVAAVIVSQKRAGRFLSKVDGVVCRPLGCGETAGLSMADPVSGPGTHSFAADSWLTTFDAPDHSDTGLKQIT